MTAILYPWQQAAWQQLQHLRARLPHAILFHGPNGIGKAAFAERFAQSLLCETPATDGQPCGGCPSCGWFDQYGHPDYRRVRPEMLDDEQSADAEPGDEAADGKKASKAPSKEIKIDQIRALSDFMNVSTHRQGMRVVVLYPVEALNSIAANALLKTLEEPPRDTVFLLVSHSLDRLLPTILSRCRQFALTMPAREQALAWLKTQQLADAETWLAEQGGSPLAALMQAQAGDREATEEFLRFLARPGVEGALKAAEKLQKAAIPELVGWLQRWQYDMFSHKLCGTVRYYPKYRAELAKLAERVEVGALLQALKTANDRRAIAEHPLSAKLFIEDMLLDYTTLFS
jgi:DNA polymerase-3 subunit delta'